MKHAIAALGITAALVLTGCSDDEPESTDGPRKISERAVALTPDDVGDWGRSVEPDWTPDRKAVESTDQVLADYIAANPDLEVDPLEDYYRQYVGVAGDAIHVNAFCRFAGAWLSSYIAVLDGGACYWQATVLADGTIEDFRTNGDA